MSTPRVSGLLVFAACGDDRPYDGTTDHRHAFGAAVQSPKAPQTWERAHASASPWEYDKT
ncbi:hypothetical protein [Polyangium sp. y55x31]|uniref:hypothetical protein n=1 Tax=Polyangium sp. y55x31 TaxID=3042688 RepID=UPI002482271C|nr:hypothetical protein [Polyangium sp. y55x31]MDI1480442.1 hypothetical protein [Polyangium sp. y55x31]